MSGIGCLKPLVVLQKPPLSQWQSSELNVAYTNAFKKRNLQFNLLAHAANLPFATFA
jgi:hypothetical protein